MVFNCDDLDIDDNGPSLMVVSINLTVSVMVSWFNKTSVTIITRSSNNNIVCMNKYVAL